jgi:RNA polymerase sigma factor (sigma-70 family)
MAKNMAERDTMQWVDAPCDATDGELVSRYAQAGDEAAFEALLRRHGQMVFGVCRRVLRNDQDAADAFQATFLVLIRKAATLRSPAALASWLYGVAHRTAQALRRAGATRRAKEAQVVSVPKQREEQSSDLAMLEEELMRLPEAYRSVVILSDLKGRTRAEVARNCGCAEGTVASRLARGRALLARRLKRRAMVLPLAALTAMLAEQTAAAALPATLLAATTKAASLFAAGQPASVVLSCQGAAAVEGVLQAMAQTKLRSAVTAAVLLLAASLAVVALAYHASGPAEEATTTVAAPPQQVVPVTSRLLIAPDPTFGTGGYAFDAAGGKNDDAFRNVAVDADGRPVAAGNSLGLAFAVRRYTQDGAPDVSFAETGTARVCIEAKEMIGVAPENDRDRPQFAHGLTIDAKGRIIVVGKTATPSPERVNDFAILRFHADGTLDPSLNQSGFIKLPASSAWNIALAATTSPDAAELIVSGYALRPNIHDPLLVRLNEAGAPDQAFGDQACASLRNAIGAGTAALATGVCIDEAGRYLVAMQMRKDRGNVWGVARVLRDGRIDDSFGRAGIWSEPLDPASPDEAAFSVLQDERARIIVAGYSTDQAGLRRLAVARLQPTGARDASFGNQGHVIFDGYGARITHKYGPRAAVCQGLIAVTGAVAGADDKRQCFGLAVLDDTGTTTGTLAPRGLPGTRGIDLPWGIAFDPQRRVVIAGSSVGWTSKKRFAVARYVVE